jgi:hypothetical protein
VERVGLQWPIDLDIAEQEVVEVRAAFERDPSPLPHRAVSAIATR